MKKLFDRHGVLLLCLILLGTITVTLFTLKVTEVTVDLAIDSFMRIQYNEAEHKTDAMTEEYEENLERSELKKSSANFVERIVANMPFLVRIIFTAAMIYFEFLIIHMYIDFVKFVICKRKAMKQHNSKRKPE